MPPSTSSDLFFSSSLFQELKGNIRVFCRVRPPLGEEKTDPSVLSHITFNDTDDHDISLVQSSESASSSKIVSKVHPFTFDKVFKPTSTQNEVFDEISQLVQSALDGYKVCIFAYGQTGSGKTYTMEGPPKCFENNAELGMIPRAVNQIFVTASSLKEKGWEYTMEASFLEIYNEDIRDLLGNNDSSKKFDIKHAAATNSTVVCDLTTGEFSPVSTLPCPRINVFFLLDVSLCSIPRDGFESPQEGLGEQGCWQDQLQREIL